MTQVAGNRFSSYFVVTVALFVTSLVISNVIAGKVVQVHGLIVPAAVVVFPLSYLLGDVLTEVYGYSAARRVIWLGFLCNLLAILAIWAGGMLPAAPFWDGQPAYDRILGATPRILLASFIAYLVGEFANAMIMSRLKVAMQGRHLWVRTIGSTLIGQGLDSAVFITIVFFDVMPSGVLLGAIVTQWLVKSAYEVIATPLTYLVVGFLKRRDGVDVYDREIDFNPLAISK